MNKFNYIKNFLNKLFFLTFFISNLNNAMAGVENSIDEGSGLNPNSARLSYIPENTLQNLVFNTEASIVVPAQKNSVQEGLGVNTNIPESFQNIQNLSKDNTLIESPVKVPAQKNSVQDEDEWTGEMFDEEIDRILSMKDEEDQDLKITKKLVHKIKKEEEKIKVSDAELEKNIRIKDKKNVWSRIVINMDSNPYSFKDIMQNKKKATELYQNVSKDIKKITKNSLAIMEKQRDIIIDLENGCTPNGEYLICGGVDTNQFFSRRKKTDGKFNLSYVITHDVAFGTSVAYSFPHIFQNSYVNSNNLGAGFYATLHFPFADGTAYLKPSVTFNNYRLKNKKNIDSNIKNVGSLDKKIKGLNIMLKFGQEISLPNDINFDWYISGGHVTLDHNNYQENTEHFLVLHENSNYRGTMAHTGVNVNIPIIKKIKWKSGLYLIHDFNTVDPALELSTMDNNMILDRSMKMSDTRMGVSSGVIYNINKHWDFTFTPSISCQNLKKYNHWKWNMNFNISGHF